MGVRYQWVVDYLEKKNDFWDNNNPGSMMITALKTFLRHSDIADKGKKYSITAFGEKISEIGIDTDIAWALILCNVIYTELFNQFISLRFLIDKDKYRSKTVRIHGKGFKTLIISLYACAGLFS